MNPAALLRTAARGSSVMLRTRPAPMMAARSAAVKTFSTTVARRDAHAEETFEEFTAR